jgi:hypothetical protein
MNQEVAMIRHDTVGVNKERALYYDFAENRNSLNCAGLGQEIVAAMVAANSDEIDYLPKVIGWGKADVFAIETYITVYISSHIAIIPRIFPRQNVNFSQVRYAGLKPGRYIWTRKSVHR